MHQYIWRTSKVIRETSEAVTIVFDTGSQGFSYKAGQFITLNIEIGEERYSRSYSLCSAPGADHAPAITVKRVQGGLVSSHIVENADSIQEWEVTGAFGSFVLPDDKAQGRPMVFIAAGSGITPIFSLLKAVLRETKSPVLLVYSSKTPDDAIYYKDLQMLMDIFQGRLRVVHFFTGWEPVDDGYKDHFQGRISRIILRKLLGLSAQSSAIQNLYYVCGPEAMISSVSSWLQSFGVPPDDIHFELFGSSAAKPAVSLPGNPIEVLLHFRDQSNLIAVAPGQTILDAAVNEQIPLPFSCKSGTCGVCRGLLTKGKVHMANNFSLTRDEAEEGHILLCQSHPLDEEVTVEMN